MPSLVTGSEYLILLGGLVVCVIAGFVVALFKK